LVAGVVGLVADVVSTGLVVVTSDGRVVWANRAMLELVLRGGDAGGGAGASRAGERATSAPGGLGWGAVHDDPVVAARFAVANAALPLDRIDPDQVAGATSRQRWQAPDGATRWLEIRRAALPPAGDSDADGAGPAGADRFVLYEIVDITDSRDDDERARRREGHRDRVEAISGTGSWEWDLSSNQMTWSDQMRALVAPVGAAAGESGADAAVDYSLFHGLIHPDDVDAVENALDTALREGEPFAFIHRLRIPIELGLDSGAGPAEGYRERVFVCVGEVLADEVDMPVRVVAASRDVTGTPDDPFALARAVALAGGAGPAPAQPAPPEPGLAEPTLSAVGSGSVGSASVGPRSDEETASPEAPSPEALSPEALSDEPAFREASREPASAEALNAPEAAPVGPRVGIDPLTGLPDRSSLVRRLRELSADEIAAGRLLVIDIDDFTGINDRHGHEAGDAVLRALAPLLAGEAPGAELHRLPGGRFAALLPGPSATDADGHYPGMTLARRLVDLVSATGARRPDDPDGAAAVSVSVGIAPLDGPRDRPGPDGAGDDRAMLTRGESAARRASAAGPGAVRIHDDEADRAAEASRQTAERVSRAIDGGFLALDAQPVIDLASREVHAYELLVRLRDNVLPELATGEFLPTIEGSEAIAALDRWVVSQAVELLATDRARERHWQLHVNISGRSLADPGFGPFVVSALRARGVEASQLGLEVSEGIAAGNHDGLRALADVLRAAGCRLALDDFGSSLGSVAFLRDHSFTSVKIDGESLAGSSSADLSSSADILVIDAIVRIARALGLYTIAENVDRDELVDALEGLGVDYAQGMRLGRPRPVAELLFDDAAATAEPIDTSVPVAALPPRPGWAGLGWDDPVAVSSTAAASRDDDGDLADGHPVGGDPARRDLAGGDQPGGDLAGGDLAGAEEQPYDPDPATMALYTIGLASRRRFAGGAGRSTAGLADGPAADRGSTAGDPSVAGASGIDPIGIDRPDLDRPDLDRPDLDRIEPGGTDPARRDLNPAGADLPGGDRGGFGPAVDDAGGPDAGGEADAGASAHAESDGVSPAEPIAAFVTTDFVGPSLSGSYPRQEEPSRPDPDSAPDPVSSGLWADDSFAGLSALGFPPLADPGGKRSPADGGYGDYRSGGTYETGGDYRSSGADDASAYDPSAYDARAYDASAYDGSFYDAPSGSNHAGATGADRFGTDQHSSDQSTFDQHGSDQHGVQQPGGDLYRPDQNGADPLGVGFERDEYDQYGTPSFGGAGPAGGLGGGSGATPPGTGDDEADRYRYDGWTSGPRSGGGFPAAPGPTLPYGQDGYADTYRDHTYPNAPYAAPAARSGANGLYEDGRPTTEADPLAAGWPRDLADFRARSARDDGEPADGGDDRDAGRDGVGGWWSDDLYAASQAPDAGSAGAMDSDQDPDGDDERDPEPGHSRGLAEAAGADGPGRANGGRPGPPHRRAPIEQDTQIVSINGFQN